MKSTKYQCNKVNKMSNNAMIKCVNALIKEGNLMKITEMYREIGNTINLSTEFLSNCLRLAIQEKRYAIARLIISVASKSETCYTSILSLLKRDNVMIFKPLWCAN